MSGGADELSGRLHVDQRVTIAGRTGTILFLGETQFASGIWVGVSLDDAVGKNNGSVHGTAYFTCPDSHGIFVREKVCNPIDGDAPVASEAAAPAGSDAADSDGDASEASEPEMSMCHSPSRARRAGVSAETAAKASDYAPPVHEKSAEARRQLSEIIRTSPDSKLQMMFGLVSADTFEKILDAMFLQSVAKGNNVIEHATEGEYFYIVKSGAFDIFVQKGDSFKKVFEAGAGFAFGELALLYNSLRSATITATVDSEVWCLDRTAFRNLVVAARADQFQAYVVFLKMCDIFQELSPEQIAALAEVLEEEEFEEDEAILEQGEKDDKMYIVMKGEAVACIKGDQGEVEVMQYVQGQYFGEIALLLGEPRKASVYALNGPCTCLYITRETFHRLLGPLQEFMKRNMEKYSKYVDAITVASAAAADERPATADIPPTPSGADGVAGSLEVFEGGVSLSKAPKTQAQMRKRERVKTDMANVVLKANKGEMGDGGEKSGEAAANAEPTTLKEKIAMDFKDPLLVTPDESFAVPDSQLQMFGGLILGQKFTEDKVVVLRTQESCQNDGQDSRLAWNEPQKSVKGSTHMGVVCQKGQKSASDPTPNQDNYFILHIGAVHIYGVCDGHGPFGHLVSFRLVQSLPKLLQNSPHCGKDWQLALKEAFVGAQQELLEFCKGRNINVEASGAAGSVLVFEEPEIHIAWIGDATIAVGSWNRRDSRLIFSTKDHKPNLPDERARLEAAGSEVREVDADNFRIYLPGSNFPGLTMSRAFGDTACGGVSQEPEYQQLFMQPTDEYYAIVASDGIWEFMEPNDVINLSAKKLRLKGPTETLRFLVEASRKRWAYCCGDYCDDITAILVQWNLKEKDVSTNHSLTFRRHE